MQITRKSIQNCYKPQIHQHITTHPAANQNMGLFHLQLKTREMHFNEYKKFLRILTLNPRLTKAHVSPPYIVRGRPIYDTMT